MSSKLVPQLLQPTLKIFRRSPKKDVPVFTQAKMPHPVELLVAATFKCSAFCPHCYLLQQNRKVFQEQTVMSEQLFQKIMASPFTQNIKRVAFLGGEALLHPSVFKWMTHARQHGIQKITSITNGLSLQDDAIVNQLLEQDNLSLFNISLDSITKEGYCKAKGIKNCDFDKICEQIERITSRFRATQTTISGSFVTKGLDAEEAHRIITFGESLGFDYIKLHAYHEATAQPDAQPYTLHRKKIKLISEQIMNRTNYRIDVRIKLPFEAARQDFYCNSLADYLCVGANGFLAPCCHMPWDEKYGHFEKAEYNPINSPCILALREKFIRAAAENNPDILPASCRFCTKRTKGKLSFDAKTKKWSLNPKKYF